MLDPVVQTLAHLGASWKLAVAGVVVPAGAWTMHWMAWDWVSWQIDAFQAVAVAVPERRVAEKRIPSESYWKAQYLWDDQTMDEDDATAAAAAAADVDVDAERTMQESMPQVGT